MESLKGKKLLVLGGSSYMIDPVLKAKSMGLYTIVTDLHGIEKAPAKLVADEYWDISLMAYDQLVPLIKENQIDGILTGFTDAFLLAYQHLCELTGLPCYATKEVFETTMDKAKFKQLCCDNDVPVIPKYDIDTFNPNTITEKHKVIIKPVDNSGSNGVVLCEKAEDYKKCLDFALSFSAKKQVVVEKYMEMDSISISYTFQDGVASLSSTDDRYVHKASNGSAVTCLSLYPSKYTDVYIEQLDGKVREMYKNAGVRNGVVAIQFFTDGRDFYAMEMGHRLTGGQHYTFTQMENGVSVLDFLIHFAVTGKMAEFPIVEKDNAKFKHTYCHLYILGKQSKIGRIIGLDYLKKMPEVFHISQEKKEGDEIGPEGTSAQKVVGLHLKVNDTNHLKKVLKDIEQNFHIIDIEGNDITINFNIDSI